ncbi:hypothetical protein FCM35_KLT16366 [Carex littledalei]|uniref:Uncharacterized protein n=1 Tax=Carex littledalei TaxID=544730 RepID=A0A833VRM2_9POAL|nr:hypothetical protein FCM35_KLT16366 [Carex littledalei]
MVSRDEEMSPNSSIVLLGLGDQVTSEIVVTTVDEFLDKSTEVHELFFPDMRSAINPLAEGNDGTGYFFPGQIWLDTDGKPIQAHGGGILYDEETRMYYWYGENKDGPTYLAHQNAAARV